MTDVDSASSLEEQAIKRKEKLKSLKRKRTDKPDEKHEASEEIRLPTPKFRSYNPHDKNLTDLSVKKSAPVNMTSEVKDLLDLAKSEVVIDQLDITTLAPRRPDWDLKRDIAKRLEKLERKTQKAMAELIRDRLKEKQDLAELANTNSDSIAS